MLRFERSSRRIVTLLGLLLDQTAHRDPRSCMLSAWAVWLVPQITTLERHAPAYAACPRRPSADGQVLRVYVISRQVTERGLTSRR